MLNIKKPKDWLISSFYFLILLGIAVWVRDYPNQPDAFGVTLQQLMQGAAGLGDPGSFATAALDVAANGWISSSNAWIFNLWPPGFVLLEAAIVKILGQDVPVIFVLQILAAAIFAGFMTLLNGLLRSWIRKDVALLLPLVIFVFPVSRTFLLEPVGISLGESYAIGFFLIGLIFSLKAVQHNALRYALYAGIYLALAAYFRSQFDIFLLALSGWGILLIIWLVYRHLRGSIGEDQTAQTSQLIKTIAVTILVAHAVTMPWRIYHKVYQDSYKWVQTDSVTFGNSVQTSEYFYSIHAGFVAKGAGNLPCRIDPTTCGHTENAQELFIRTFLNHPVEWYSLKLEIIGPYWVSPVENWTSVVKLPTTMDVFINAILLGSLIGSIALLCMPSMRRHQIWSLLVWFNLALLSANVLIFTVQQFEVRYFYFLKIFGLAMFIIQASLFFYIYKEHRKLAVTT